MATKYVRDIMGGGQLPVEFLVNDTQTIVRGSVLAIATGKVSLVGDAAAAGTVAGVAMEAITTTTATAADKILVDTNPNSVFNMTHSGSATPAIGVAYDFVSDGVFDSDDSTGGIFMVVGNVATNTADVMITNRYNQIG